MVYIWDYILYNIHPTGGEDYGKLKIIAYENKEIIAKKIENLYSAIIEVMGDLKENYYKIQNFKDLPRWEDESNLTPKLLKQLKKFLNLFLHYPYEMISITQPAKHYFSDLYEKGRKSTKDGFIESTPANIWEYLKTISALQTNIMGTFEVLARWSKGIVEFIDNFVETIYSELDMTDSDMEIVANMHDYVLQFADGVNTIQEIIDDLYNYV